MSLSPAISRTLVDLGAGDHVVGRTAFCRALPESVPVVGDLHRIDYERLVRLKPTHVLVQPSGAGPDPGLERLGEELGFRVFGWSSLNAVSDIRQLLRELPGAVAGPGSDLRTRMASRSLEIDGSLNAMLDPGNTESFERPVLIVSGIDPVLAFGSGTYLDDVLKTLGGRNAVMAGGWVQLSLEDVVRLEPQAIVVISTNSADRDRRIESALRALPVSASTQGRVAVLRHPDALLPSSAIVPVAGALRRILIELKDADYPDERGLRGPPAAHREGRVGSYLPGSGAAPFRAGTCPADMAAEGRGASS